MSNVSHLNLTLLPAIVAESKTLAEVFEKYGLRRNSGNQTIRRAIKKLDISHFNSYNSETGKLEGGYTPIEDDEKWEKIWNEKFLDRGYYSAGRERTSGGLASTLRPRAVFRTYGYSKKIEHAE